jgi:glycosyltransferase involved in cell wall biosynthesis
MDVLVVPSLWLENSPFVVHEAFLAGVPVVAARIGGLADLVEHERNGLLYEATSAAALAAVLHRLVEEPGLLARLAAAVPVVKGIDEDAREWDARYVEALENRRRGARP